MPEPTTPVTLTFAAPYELVAIKFLELLTEIIKGQPQEVKAELWKISLEDLKEFRAFVKSFK